MQTLGVSDSTPQDDSRLKNLFWPTVRTAIDVDTLGTQGYWICTIVAAVLGVSGLLNGQWIIALLVVFLYYLGAVGVRQHSCFAAVVVFAFFLLDTIVSPFSFLFVVKLIVCVVLLSNLRATFVASFWEPGESQAAMPMRFAQTWGDKFVDKLPAWLWPKIRIGYYIYASIFVAFATLGLAMAIVARFDPQLLRQLR